MIKIVMQVQALVEQVFTPYCQGRAIVQLMQESFSPTSRLWAIMYGMMRMPMVCKTLMKKASVELL